MTALVTKTVEVMNPPSPRVATFLEAVVEISEQCLSQMALVIMEGGDAEKVKRSSMQLVRELLLAHDFTDEEKAEVKVAFDSGNVWSRENASKIVEKTTDAITSAMSNQQLHDFAERVRSARSRQV